MRGLAGYKNSSPRPFDVPGALKLCCNIFLLYNKSRALFLFSQAIREKRRFTLKRTNPFAEQRIIMHRTSRNRNKDGETDFIFISLLCNVTYAQHMKEAKGIVVHYI